MGQLWLREVVYESESWWFNSRCLFYPRQDVLRQVYVQLSNNKSYKLNQKICLKMVSSVCLSSSAFISVCCCLLSPPHSSALHLIPAYIFTCCFRLPFSYHSFSSHLSPDLLTTPCFRCGFGLSQKDSHLSYSTLYFLFFVIEDSLSQSEVWCQEGVKNVSC